MKKALIISGSVLLLLVIIVAGCHHIRHNRSEMRGPNRMMMGSNFRHNRDFHSNRYMMKGMHKGVGRRGDMRQPMGPRRMAMMHRGMGQGMMGMDNGMRRGMGQGMMGMAPGMRRGMDMMNHDSTGWNQMGRGAGNMMGQMGNGAGRGMGQMRSMDNSPVGPGGIILENIPNVTDKQKKEFAELLKSQQEEMTKMRSEMAAKIKSTIESQRAKMLKLFTEEQKKSIGVR